MKTIEIKADKIKKAFEKETGIAHTEIKEIHEAFPATLDCHILTETQTFKCKLTQDGLAKKGTFHEEK